MRRTMVLWIGIAGNVCIRIVIHDDFTFGSGLRVAQCPAGTIDLSGGGQICSRSESARSAKCDKLGMDRVNEYQQKLPCDRNF